MQGELKDNEPELDKAAKYISEQYLKLKNDNEFKKIIDYESSVLDKWSKIFRVDNIDNLDEKVFEFFNFNENHHWNGISRSPKNLDEFKDLLRIILDENEDIKERLEKAKSELKNFDKARITPILMVSNPNKYGVWNKLSQNALNNLNIQSPGWDFPQNYKDVNNILLKLKDKVAKEIPEENFDLWKLDAVLGEIGKEKRDVDSELNDSKVQWWIEKTYTVKPRVKGLLNTTLGKELWSPQTDKSGKLIYKNMKEIKPNDVIIHLVQDKEKSFLGISLAKTNVNTFTIPAGTIEERTGDVPGYKVELEGYIELETPIKWDYLKNKYKEKLLEIYNNNHNLFYNKRLDLSQGKYITKAPLEFVTLLNDEYRNSTNKDLPHYNSTSLNNNINDTKQINQNNNDRLPKNIILHGPVGTGKTYLARKLAVALINDKIKSFGDIEKLLTGEMKIDDDGSNERMKFITFHQSYSYEDFIEGMKADIENNQIVYEIKDGIFKELCNEAKGSPERTYVLIIDEINRGDISRIFGELISLIEDDKRCNKENEINSTLPYSRKSFCVPDNVFIIGTMNDSDRSIALLDVALRRRFTFINIEPNPKILEEWIKGIPQPEDRETIINFFNKLNKRIVEKKGLDFRVGHAFFKSINGSEDPKSEMLLIFKYRLYPLIHEIFHDENDSINYIFKELYDDNRDNSIDSKMDLKDVGKFWSNLKKYK